MSVARGIGGEDLGRETSMTKVGVATLIGALVEWYDYSLYGLAASVGLFRPVGGAIFGHYGDRLGRKTILVLTLLLKAVVSEVDPPLPCLPLSITQEASGHPARWLRRHKRLGVQYHCTPL